MVRIVGLNFGRMNFIGLAMGGLGRQNLAAIKTTQMQTRNILTHSTGPIEKIANREQAEQEARICAIP
jgi:hypothetical protein